VLDINSPEVLAVPVEECGEPLVSLLRLARLRVRPMSSWRAAPAESARLLARAGVRQRLGQALDSLPEGVGLRVVGAYRSPAEQRRRFRHRLRRARALNPAMREAELRAVVSWYVAEPDVYAPHTTGAAIDVSLVDRAGLDLDVGERGHRVGAATESAEVTPIQRQNRAILVAAMHGAGFVNYPHEWWHWSYGDRFWGCMTGRAAIYDSVTLRESTTARLLRTLHWAWIQGK